LYPLLPYSFFSIFFFNAPSSSDIYTLSLHDALPICHFFRVRLLCRGARWTLRIGGVAVLIGRLVHGLSIGSGGSQRYGHQRNTRSEEHTSELQSRENLVCRLLLEKKKKKTIISTNIT